MAKTLQIDVSLGIDKARQALKQLQQEANQIVRSQGGGSGGGSGGSSGGLGNFGLSAAGAAAGAAAAAIAAVGAELKSLASRATELSQSASSANSQLGQLRSSIEKAGIAKDIAATSPGSISLAKALADFDKEKSDAANNALTDPKARAAALNERLQGGLGGAAGEQWRRIKEQRVDQEKDISLARTALDRQTFVKQRDYAIQLRDFSIDTGRQQYDLQVQSGRLQQDQQIAVQKFQENFANTQATKAYNLSRQFAAQNFQRQQGYAQQDQQIGRSDKAFDFNLSQSRNQNEFGISQSRNQTEFNINKSRQGEDYSESLQKAVLGGANGMDLMWMSRDFRKEQTRQAQDLARSKSIATQDFERTKGYAQQDYGISASRDARNFGISQGRATADFNQQAKEAAASRQLELEAQEYARKYEGLELNIQLNRQTQDLALAFARLNQDIDRGQQALQRQGQDMQYDTTLAYSNFDLQTGRQRRNAGYTAADFAGAQRDTNPLGAVGQGMKDADFAKALAANSQQTGQLDIFKQFNDTVNAKGGVGAQIGDIIRTLFVEPFQQSMNVNDPKFWSLNPLDWFKKSPDKPFNPNVTAPPSAADLVPPNPNGYNGGPDFLHGRNASPNVTVVAGGNNTYQINGGIDPGLMGQIQNYVDDQDKKNQSDIMDMIRRFYGG